MHLLDVNTFELRDRDELGSSIKYAILSHRWTDEDKTFPLHLFMPSSNEDEEMAQSRLQFKQRLKSARSNSSGENRAVAKVARACHMASEDGIPYIWIDTCCIDKRPGADVRQISIALTSMFRWYQEAQVCYTYLQDVSISQSGGWQDQFKKSEWFTRGWTLQELLAPRNLRFFDQNWTFMGTKQSMWSEIQEASGIEATYLNGDFTGACIAVKMSWISKRMTTLREDMAYCMLGIFGVPMNVQYGWGEIEFLRLEEILVGKFDDESIFAWADTGPREHQKSEQPIKYGLLAPWPSLFQNSTNLTVERDKLHKPRNEGGHKVEKDGIRFPVPMRWPDHGNGIDWNNLAVATMRTYKLGLNCWQIGQEKKGSVTIYLEKDQNRQWRRTNTQRLDFDKSALRKSFRFLFPKTRPLLVPHQVRGENEWGSVLADRVEQEIKRKLAVKVPLLEWKPALPIRPARLQNREGNEDESSEAERQTWRKSEAQGQPFERNPEPVPRPVSSDYPEGTGSVASQTNLEYQSLVKAQIQSITSINRKPVLPPRRSFVG